jgi:hypothetical protein
MREEGHLTELVEESEEADLLRQYQSSPIRPILDILDPEGNKARNVVVTGDPGAGKSALLKYLCLRWADEPKEPVPILIDLKEYGKKREGPLAFCQSGLAMPRFEATELDELLRAGKAALYLDGLDEVFVPATRNSVIEEIIAISAEYPHAQIVVTSRKVGYQPERLASAGFIHATLEDFYAPQIDEFLEKWHRLAEEDEATRHQLSERLKRAITETASIRELAGNPLLLTMMAILNRSQDLPRNRVSLYRKASEVLLHDWDANRALQTAESLDRDDKEKLLRDLAGEMQQAGGGLAGNLIEKHHLVNRFRQSLDQLGISDSRSNALALVRQLEERNFILASVGADRFSFVHRTFLEYFCAAWFVERLDRREGSDNYLSLDQLKLDVYGRHWADEKWQEVLRLIAGMVHETKAAELIEFLTSSDGTKSKMANLMLAAGCLYEVRNRKAIPYTEQLLWDQLTQQALQKGPRIPRSAYQMAKNDVRRIAIGWISSVWRGDKALAWLKETAYKGPTFSQIAAIEEIARAWKHDPETFPWLQQRASAEDAGDGCAKAVEEIVREWSQITDLAFWLKKLARDGKGDYARREAIDSLATRFNDDPEVLPLIKDRAIYDDDWFVRSGSLLSMAGNFPPDPEMQCFLLNRFSEDLTDEVRARALWCLAWKWPNDHSITDLVKDRARSDESKIIRETALRVLENTHGEDAEVIALIAASELQSAPSPPPPPE